jgi:hypothetical protein
MFSACAFAHVFVIVATLVNCFKITFLPVGMVSVDVVQINDFLINEFQTAGSTSLALLLKGFRGFTIVELTFTFAPVGCITVIGGFCSFDHDVIIFGVGNCWECLFNPHSADVTQIIDIFEKSQPEKFYLPNFSA